ncbi:General transcription factor II-I repeat domain-containing protein 2 [Chionoecetes opilio]|uniref:General transcription factor II-I repeat domain-containing protein 2 n=1 Tax=Chionoecetes opilio TaxID=41210 RepID=A0A8J4YBJ3_CHIOP|nr:General transcription factor II-I repeat domain-containing protein 2 [Chionoecetes opilio]
MLSRVCDLQQEIATFLRQKNLPVLIIFPTRNGLLSLALLTDITTHLNDLNVKLQGKNILVTDMYSHITAFEVKLRLWEAQLAAGQFMLFFVLRLWTDDVDLNTCVGVVLFREELLPVQGGPWLQGFTVHLPFDSWDEPLPPCRWSVELQCNDELKAKTYRSFLHCPSSVPRLPLTNFQITLSCKTHLVAFSALTVVNNSFQNEIKHSHSLR